MSPRTASGHVSLALHCGVVDGLFGVPVRKLMRRWPQIAEVWVALPPRHPPLLRGRLPLVALIPVLHPSVRRRR